MKTIILASACVIALAIGGAGAVQMFCNWSRLN